MGIELAKFAIQIVGFKVARNLKPIFNALMHKLSIFSEQLKINHKQSALAIH
jgi:hypothetical protein